jgi:hypothetical protein
MDNKEERIEYVLLMSSVVCGYRQDANQNHPSRTFFACQPPSDSSHNIRSPLQSIMLCGLKVCPTYHQHAPSPSFLACRSKPFGDATHMLLHLLICIDASYGRGRTTGNLAPSELVPCYLLACALAMYHPRIIRTIACERMRTKYFRGVLCLLFGHTGTASMQCD